MHVCTRMVGVGMVAGVEVSIDGGQTWRQGRWSPGLGPAQGPGLVTSQKQGLGPGLVTAQKQGLGPGLGPGQKQGLALGLGPGLAPGQKQGLAPGLGPEHKRLWERAFPLWPVPAEEDPLLCPLTDTHTRALYQVM